MWPAQKRPDGFHCHFPRPPPRRWRAWRSPPAPKRASAAPDPDRELYPITPEIPRPELSGPRMRIQIQGQPALKKTTYAQPGPAAIFRVEESPPEAGSLRRLEWALRRSHTTCIA